MSTVTAATKGGGFYLIPYYNLPTIYGADLCLYDFRVDSNSAPDGAAIYAASLYAGGFGGTSVFFNPAFNCGPEAPATLGAVTCAAGTRCNEVSDNNAVDASGKPTGSIIDMNWSSSLAAERLLMRGNKGTTMISAIGAYVENYLHGCLIIDNHAANGLIFSEAGYEAPPTVANCTLANNTIDNGYVIFAESAFVLTDTIIDQPGVLSMGFQSDCNCGLMASYVMSNDISTLPSSSNIIAIVPSDPLFVDSANGNYHLVAYRQNGLLTATRAIDFAPTVGGDAAHDFDGNAFGIDVPAVPDAYGTRDLGAFEALPISDRLFADGFGDRVSLVY